VADASDGRGHPGLQTHILVQNFVFIDIIRFSTFCKSCHESLLTHILVQTFVSTNIIRHVLLSMFRNEKRGQRKHLVWHHKHYLT